MPWPKGQPRKGHMNKDGSQHGHLGRPSKGDRLTVGTGTSVSVVRSRRSKPTIADGTTTASPETATTSGSQETATSTKRHRYTTPLTHPTWSIEQCPNCGFPEADGSYCPDCGWSLPVKYGVRF